MSTQQEESTTRIAAVSIRARKLARERRRQLHVDRAALDARIEATTAMAIDAAERYHEAQTALRRAFAQFNADGLDKTDIAALSGVPLAEVKRLMSSTRGTITATSADPDPDAGAAVAPQNSDIPSPTP